LYDNYFLNQPPFPEKRNQPESVCDHSLYDVFFIIRLFENDLPEVPETYYINEVNLLDVTEKYGSIIKKRAPKNPAAAKKMILAGLYFERYRAGHMADRQIPPAYKKLNVYAVNEVLQGISHPEKTVWTNLFAPVELLQCFGLHTLSVECLSSFMSGFHIEDYFLDYADGEGISPTLCSYHRNFIGAVDSGVIAPAAFTLTTSTICDGNINTFRHLSEQHHIPSYVIDVPEHCTEESILYVMEQIKELIRALELTFHKKLDMQELRKILIRENESKASYERTLKMLSEKSYKNTLTLQMYLLLANHLNIGTQEILDFYLQMEKEVSASPDFHGKKIFWIHLVPYYQSTLQSYFNLSDKYQIQGIDLSLDYRAKLDVDDPVRALACKMLNNVYTGSYERKADLICDIVNELEPDGIINFCQWGCKQSAGGIMILKERLQRLHVPLLIIDGDGMDRRNSHDGQIKTRLEAFLEILNQGK